MNKYLSLKKKYKKSLRNTGGFTFLELMIVIIIISVMAAVSAPKFTEFYSSLKLRNNARRLKLFFLYARNTALVKKRNCRIYYIAKEKSFLIKQKRKKNISKGDNNYNSDDNIIDKYQTIGGVLRKITLNKGVRLISAQEIGALPVPRNTDFNFDIKPYGIDNAYMFTIANNYEDKIKIVIMAGSGNPKIFNENSESYYGE
ncbi:MAG: prepilin-type N-terminal cleavage/methylation domain-containing protein [Victivallales bacterium]|nr:prepilin-type N-terminal cleavage/methylation domain-containing protein [Victivallales bacterium]MCF7888766.1 prepilin-type N-terminal cleavage/methylation domain-containing protein [Victivallales bacterium]